MGNVRPPAKLRQTLLSLECNRAFAGEHVHQYKEMSFHTELLPGSLPGNDSWEKSSKSTELGRC